MMTKATSQQGSDLSSHLNEVLADATLYLRKKQVTAALDILAEEEASFEQALDLAQHALTIINHGFLYFLSEGTADADNANRASDQFFRVASLIEPRVRDIDPGLLALYKKALLITQSAAKPLRRVFRQTSLIELLRTTRGIVGSLAECGCARGMSSMQIAQSIAAESAGWRGEGFHICDSFQGLSEPAAEDRDMSGMTHAEAKRVTSMTYAGSMAFAYEHVSQVLWQQFPALALHKGWIPEVFEELPDTRYRFVHVDVDLYAPTLATFEYFYPRLTRGGVIVTDDYNWPGGRKAVDQFCARHGLALQFTASKLAYVIANG